VQQNAPSAIGSQALLSAQLIENPIDNEEINISYQMGRTALVTMELRDVLGRMVPLSYAKYQLEQPGDHTATISAPNLPPGTYYLRITTDVGDAITLKVVKE
jgi:Secretion system C-terminal sorting domain